MATITDDDLWGAVHDIGSEVVREPIRPEVLKVLTDMNAVEVGSDGPPTLTRFGWLVYTIMESGDGDVPEFEAFAKPTRDDSPPLI